MLLMKSYLEMTAEELSLELETLKKEYEPLKKSELFHISCCN